MKNLLVVGSLNIDYVVNLHQMPQKGETVIGNTMTLSPGGKGANQAYAAARLGSHVTMLGAVGQDKDGETLLKNLESAGVNIHGILKLKDHDTGKAIVYVDATGENSIVVLPGSNYALLPQTLEKYPHILAACDILLMQLEIPLETVAYLAEHASKLGKIVVLDPAPAPQHLPKSLLQYVDVIKPNETELASLTGMPTHTMENVCQAAQILLDQGVKTVLVTLGEKGCVLVNAEGNRHFPGLETQVVDTTAAGDSFIAAFCTALAEGRDYEQAIRFGNLVSSITVSRKGAQTSIPFREEVDERLL